MLAQQHNFQSSSLCYTYNFHYFVSFRSKYFPLIFDTLSLSEIKSPLHDKVFTEHKCGDDGQLCVTLMGVIKDTVKYKNHAFILTVHNLEFSSIQKGVQQYMPGTMQTQ